MITNISYNVIIERFRAFAEGHFLIKGFTHGDPSNVDLLKGVEFPWMHVFPVEVAPQQGSRLYSFIITFADLPRDKETPPEYQREMLSDCIRLAEDLLAEIKNGLTLFGPTVELDGASSIECFINEFSHTLTGVNLSLTLSVPWDWNACDIPADWSVGGSGSGGSGVGLGLILETNGVLNGNQSLLNLQQGTNITLVDNGNGTVTINSTGGGGGGSGTVTSVALTMPSGFVVSGSPITTAGTLAITGAGTSSDYIDGTGAVQAFPVIPSGTVTSVGLSLPAPANPAFSVSGSPVTTSGTITISANGTSSQLIDGTGALQTIPTGLPPTGSAGGDLSGTYPNPNVDRVHGIDFQSGTPSTGDVWLYEGSPAKWQHQQLPAVHVGNDSAVTGSTVKDALNHLNTTKVDSNAAITAGTATKITYDAKGLVTAGTTLAASDIPSGVDAAKIGTGVVSNTEFGYLDGVTSAIQTQLNSKPAKDTTILAYTNTIQIGAGLTTYIPISGSAAANATESFVQLAMPYAGTIKNLYVRYNGTQSNTGNLTITTRKNGVNQTLAVTLTNADGALGVKSDTTNSFSVVAGDLINIILVNSATTQSGRFVSVSLILERS